ncbi:phytanoyl-CoA dioxygenase family protein [Paraburkholderia elongata]|uniref:Phytanoyl-CoA dioxygenase n=1 Tax=Paraburkholderia elongata TaxID=2675747 RepID=A0A972SJV4_9BURK|nr:phytanoyl-CoA dioxygenase family protein [Paraburkholderia elongata]NPT53895.1 phytanoyl-CoA dioxygenase [Paraburkholderia elongata]
MTTSTSNFSITEDQVSAFARDGAICLRGIFADWVPTLAAGIERNMKEPGIYGSDIASGKPGKFFDDYCNWQRIPEFRDAVMNSPAAAVAAKVMGSKTAQFFHDHVLVKEAGTQKATPWHQDIPYYFLSGEQSVSFWIPVDPVKEATLRLVAGSHRWSKMIRPVHWVDDSSFYGGEDKYRDVPDPDNEEGTRVLEWEMEPGDAVLFNFRTAHGARGNTTTARRRVISLRWIGDDARYASRPGKTSPPFPGHGMADGDRLREDWFPVVWTGGTDAGAAS